MTRVGMWYTAACIVVGVAATNTGNNGLFLATAMMLAAFVLTHWLGWLNVHGLDIELDCRDEIFANRLATLGVRLRNRGRFLPKSLLVVSVQEDDMQTSGRPRRHRTAPWLVPFLPARHEEQGELEVIIRRRGPRRIRAVQVTTLFPIGVFRKGRRYEQDFEILVFPELFHPSGQRHDEVGSSGDRSARRAGQSHELYALREYQNGDDPRGIHWKQTARQGELIYQQRSREENRRLRIVFDNAVGTLDSEEEVKRFERLVSEAATSAVDHLAQGYEVALTTRDTQLSYASGPRQRINILEALARVQTRPEEKKPLATDDERQGDLRLAMVAMDTGAASSGLTQEAGAA